MAYKHAENEVTHIKLNEENECIIHHFGKFIYQYILYIAQ